METQLGETPKLSSGPLRARMERLAYVRRLRDEILKEYPDLATIEDIYKKRKLKWEIQSRLKTKIMETLGSSSRTTKEYLDLVYP